MHHTQIYGQVTKQLLVFNLLLFLTGCCSIPNKFNGKLLDQNLKPIKNAEVFFYDYEKVKSDSLGQFELYYNVTIILETSWKLKIKDGQNSTTVLFPDMEAEKGERYKKVNDTFIIVI